MQASVRTGIAASLAEGAAIGVVFNVLEQWFVPLLQIRLIAAPWQIFLLTLVPLAANAVIGPWVGPVIRRLGGPRRTTAAVGRFQALCLVGLVVPTCWPTLPGALVLAMGLATAIPASMAISQPAWLAWMGAMVPARVQGVFFGRRNRLLMATKLGSACVFAGIFVVLPLEDGPLGMVLLLAAALVARLVAVRMLLRQPEPAPRPSSLSGRQALANPPPRFAAFVRGLGGSHFGRWNIVWSSLFFGVMVAGPAFSPYMLAPVAAGGLGLAERPLVFTALLLSCQITRLAAFPLVGRLVDALGPTQVLRGALIGVTAIPVAWALAADVPVLIAIELANGVCWCAAECAGQVLVLGCHRDAEVRARLIGFHQTLLGLVQIVAVLLGMVLLPLLPPLDGSRFRALFMISILLRVPAVILVWTYLPRLAQDRRRALRGLWRELPGVGLVATFGRGLNGLMRRVIDPAQAYPLPTPAPPTAAAPPRTTPP